MPESRGQLSLSVAEVGIGILFVFAVTAGFALGVPAPPTDDTQLELYAADAAAVLAGEPPRHQGTTRLSEIVRSESAFERERDALSRRVDRILPDNLMYRVETEHGAVGFRQPAGVPTGHASVATVEGRVTIRVWYV